MLGKLLVRVIGLTLAMLIADGASVVRAADESRRIIFDTDMDSDCDDVGALAMLHILADRGEVELLATICSARSEWAPRCVDAINTWYGRPDLPIGAPKNVGAKQSSRYARPIAERFPHDLTSDADAEEAAELYRRVLSEQPDDSVVIVTVGDLTNIASLLKLPATQDQPSGLAVVHKHVREWVCMGGNFIGRPAKDDLKLTNNNFTGDKQSSYEAIRSWPGRLTFVGREIGSVPSGLKVGGKLQALPVEHPVRVGYEAYFGGPPRDRHVADQTAVLYAARGLGEFWTVESTGYMDVQPDNTFEWRYDRDGDHAYLLKRATDANSDPKPDSIDRRVETVIEELMMAPPVAAAAK
ncbi:MAG TPA: nucleoside hydrolase [Pirellulales bacterium]